MSTISSSFEAREPNIRKAKFILPNERIYTLDFDHNIEMQELKLMIQKAAHLRRNTFRLFSNGEEYTQYNEEIFDKIFPHQKLVSFTLEVGEGEENFDETELLLQMNSPCPIHIEKFLLYYCFTCNTSICSECFTNGIHKNHKIQDKCFYLLPSKYLVDKIFENWSNNPYDDYQISVDLSQLKTEVNNIMFDKLFKMLKNIQEKCNYVIEEYNQVNFSSLGNIRDSVRDIKVTCIKALDKLKEELNIKDIVNNPQIFIEFDSAYKEMGKIQNEKFKQNLVIFQELNKKISPLVSDLVKRIYTLINKTLNDCLNEQLYESIKTQISQKFIKPADKNEILVQLSEHKKRRKSFMNITNNQKNSILSIQEKLKSDQGKNINSIQNNINIINPFSTNDNVSSQNQNKSFIIPSTGQVTFGYVSNTIGQSNTHFSPLKENQNVKFGINSNNNNIASNYNEKVDFINQVNIIKPDSEIEEKNKDFNLNSNYGAQNEISKIGIGPYSSAQATRQVFSTNVMPKVDTSNLFSASHIRETSKFNDISYSSSNVTNSNNNINTNINILNNGANNNNATSTTTTQIISNQNNDPSHIYKTIETKTTTTTTKTIIPNTVLTNIIDNNTNTNTNNLNNINSMINNGTVVSYTSNSGLDNFAKYMNKKNIIPEEFTESDTEIRRPTDIRRFLNTEYILCPVTQTNSIKIMTSDNHEERSVPLTFPENFGSNSFLLDCAHCNCYMNKCLYVSGGIEQNSEQKRSKSLLCVDITKPDELKVVKKASMNFARCGHTMISDNKYIYAVGGEDMNSVERYDIENDIWEILPNMIFKRMYPILYVHNGYLYAFFGKYINGEYPCSIERLNINGSSGIEKPSWEMITFSNQKNLDLRYYGCALHEINGLLYFFGGKCNEKSTGKIFFYNFERRFIEKEDSEVLWKEYFRENKLYKLGERLVQCSESKYFGVYINLKEQ